MISIHDSINTLEAKDHYVILPNVNFFDYNKDTYIGKKRKLKYNDNVNRIINDINLGYKRIRYFYVRSRIIVFIEKIFPFLVIQKIRRFKKFLINSKK